MTRRARRASDGARPIVLAVFSDLHAGSTLAPCHPDGVTLDDGGHYDPSAVQVWLWAQWLDYWAQVASVQAAHGATLGVLSNGDLVDGPGHHKTHQSVSPNTADAQSEIVHQLLAVPKALRPDWWVFVKGTGSHVGNGGDAENGAGRSVGAIKDPATGQHSWYRWRAELHGVRIDAAHHGRMGTRPWTKLSALGILAAEIVLRHAEEGLAPPHLAIRSHKHTPGDSGTGHATRLLATPAWQLMTEFGHKVVPEAAINSVVGGYILVIHPSGRFAVHEHFYRVAPAPLWRPA